MKTAPSVVTIGNFDGVHIGHAGLIRAAREIAESRGTPTRVVAMAFEPHPLTRLNPAAAPARLTTFENRVRLLGLAGADEVARLEPTGQVLGMSPEEFLDHVAKELGAVAIVEGPDFRFGRNRAADVVDLKRLAGERGIEVRILAPIEVTMSDHTVAPASSSLARWLINRGRLTDAAYVLGRAYEVEGIVERGDQRGRQLGYPTANVRTECLLPGDGVYAGSAMLPDGREIAAAISIGTKPMFDGTQRTLEAHILGKPDLSGLPDYGWATTIRFTRWLRDQLKFESIDALKVQIESDCRQAAEVPSHRPTIGQNPSMGQGAVYA